MRKDREGPGVRLSQWQREPLLQNEKEKDACGIYTVGVLDANSFHFSTCL